jgi:hypothetical protein
MSKSIPHIREKWAGTMTDRERFNKQMHYQPVDRCFNREFGYWQECFSQWDIFVDNNITSNDQADVFFQFDRMVDIVPKHWLHPGFEQKVISETETMQVIQNRDGLTAELPKDDHSTIPHYTGSSIKTPTDWAEVKAAHCDPAHPDRQVDIDALKKQFGPCEQRDFPLGVNCGSMIGRVRDALTFEGLAYATFDYPEMVEDMVETCCMLVENFLDQVLPHFQFDYASGWEDICFKNGPICSVDFMEKVVGPRYKRIAEKLHAHDIDLWYTDCDGDVRPILHAFLGNGINCLFPFEVMGCAHPRELLDEYGQQLRIMGGINKIEMAKGPDAIKAYLESVIPCVERGGYIPFCDHRCPPDVSPADYLYYLDLKKELFGPGGQVKVCGGL